VPDSNDPTALTAGKLGVRVNKNMKRAYLSTVSIVVMIYWVIGKLMIAAYYNDSELLGYDVDLTFKNINAGIKGLNYNDLHFIIDRIDLTFFLISIVTILLIIYYHSKEIKKIRYGACALLFIGLVPLGLMGLASFIMMLLQFPPDGEWLGEGWPTLEALGLMTAFGLYTNIISIRKHKYIKAPNHLMEADGE